MENILYNELKGRDYSVDVGVVELTEKNNEGKRTQKNLEIDFIARKGVKKYYIQSVFNMDDDDEKQKAELRPLISVDDSFRKIVVSKSYGRSWTDEYGILHIGLLDFLLDENCMDR